MKRYAVIALLLLSFGGLADAAYLAQHEATGTPLLCDLGSSFSGCNVVAQSPYAQLFGIPLADFGLGFYAMLFVLIAFELAYPRRDVRRVIQLAAVVGVAASAYFTYLQVFRIGALCVYCLLSAVIDILILVIAARLEPWRVRRAAAPPES